MMRRNTRAAVLAGSVLGFAGTAAAINVSVTDNATTLANKILGPGITLVNASYSGAGVASGTFTGGAAAGIGINEGIVLTSGAAGLVDDLNDSDGTTGANYFPGNADLNALIPGYTTFDATVLSLTFETTGGDLFFNYVFGSEEYNEYSNSSYNDVFGFFINGQNIALIPGTTTPVSINNVNGGNPLGVNASNPQYYNNNDLSDGGPFFSFEYDGFTDVFTAQILNLGAGEHTIELAIADAGDYILDSGVFIQAGSFSDIPQPPGVPDGGTTAMLLGLAFAGLGWVRRQS